MGAVGKPYPPNLPPCRGKVAWPKAMTDEGASGDGRDGQRPFLFPCRKKKRFLESKEKGAPVGVRWLQIGFRRPVFTPPLRTDPVHSGLPRWNRERLWSYPTFFRRLRRRGSGRGAAARYSLCCGAQRRLFTIHSSLFSLPSICGAHLSGCAHGIQLPLDGGTKQTRGAPRRGAPLLRCYAASAAGSVLLSAAGKRSSYHSSSASPRPERTWSRKAVSSG